MYWCISSWIYCAKIDLLRNRFPFSVFSVSSADVGGKENFSCICPSVSPEQSVLLQKPSSCRARGKDKDSFQWHLRNTKPPAVALRKNMGNFKNVGTGFVLGAPEQERADVNRGGCSDSVMILCGDLPLNWVNFGRHWASASLAL